ncbi:MAG: hypothetical protein Q7R81_05900 [Candidatus Peregrinibacteria bacterium]|nr:hypothetical protein [Candidatus Peregrinibacteria bacterium]
MQMLDRLMVVTPCRSGSTMVLRAFRNHPLSVPAGFQSVKEGQRREGKADYGFFEQEVPPGKVLVGKETIGYGTEEDCTLPVFPNKESIGASRQLFVFREPRSTYQSWLENNLVPEGDPRLFITAYRHAYELLCDAKFVRPDAVVMTYETLCEHPERVLQEICKRIGIPYDAAMLDWKDDFLATPGLDREGVEQGHYDSVASSRTIQRSKKEGELLPDHAEEIDRKLLRFYNEVRKWSEDLLLHTLQICP